MVHAVCGQAVERLKCQVMPPIREGERALVGSLSFICPNLSSLLFRFTQRS
jgi:hypothetical protein